MQEITIKYHSDHQKHIYELVEELEKQVNGMFIDENLAIKVIMDCRITSAHKFKTRLGFKKYGVILTKEQSVLTKIISSFEEEIMQARYNVLTYRIDLYFHHYKLAIEIDENGHIDRTIDYKIQKKNIDYKTKSNGTRTWL